MWIGCWIDVLGTQYHSLPFAPPAFYVYFILSPKKKKKKNKEKQQITLPTLEVGKSNLRLKKSGTVDCQLHNDRMTFLFSLQGFSGLALLPFLIRSHYSCADLWTYGCYLSPFFSSFLSLYLSLSAYHIWQTASKWKRSKYHATGLGYVVCALVEKLCERSQRSGFNPVLLEVLMSCAACWLRIYFQRPLAWRGRAGELILGRATLPVDFIHNTGLYNWLAFTNNVSISFSLILCFFRSHDAVRFFFLLIFCGFVDDKKNTECPLCFCMPYPWAVFAFQSRLTQKATFLQ